MGNAFDQFDTPAAAPVAGNAFDQFDPRTNRAGLAARTGIQGLTAAVMGTPALIADAATAIPNVMYMGENYLSRKLKENTGVDLGQAELFPRYLSMVGPAGEELADIAGTPAPQTTGERAAVNIGSGAIGALGPGGLGRLMMRAPGALATAGEALSSTPILDFLSGGTGAAGGEVASNLGGGPKTQFAASLVASLLPYVGAVVGRRAITPFPSTLTPEQQRLAGVLQRQGIPLSAGQQVGSTPLKYMESQVSQLPGGSLLAENPAANQSQNLVQAALRHAGVEADAATPDVLNQAHTDIGGEIGSIIQGKRFSVDGQFRQDLFAVDAKYTRRLPTDIRPQIESYIQDLLAHRQAISGETYQAARTDLGRAIRAQNGPNGNKGLQDALIHVQDALDSLVDRSLGSTNPSIVEDLAAARQKYANLLTIEDAVARSGEAGARGELTPTALEASLKGNVGRRQYTRGFGQLNDLARASSAILRNPPNSGTATRLAPYELARQMFYGGGIGYAAGGTPGAIIGGAAAGAAPAAAGALVNSPLMQAYFKNQLLPGSQRLGYGAIPGLLGGQ